MFSRLSLLRAVAASVLPLLAIMVIGYLIYSAGAYPADPKDKYLAWYIGFAVLSSGILVVLYGRSPKRVEHEVPIRQQA
jgi:hypothetical protein